MHTEMRLHSYVIHPTYSCGTSYNTAAELVWNYEVPKIFTNCAEPLPTSTILSQSADPLGITLGNI
jgi:hypothetical protein